MSQPLIRLNNVTKRYPSITLTYPDMVFHKNRILLRGENGSGKSTLLQAMLGLIQYQGTIESSGRLSYMPEHPSLPRDCSVLDFLSALGCEDPQMWLTRFGLLDKQHDRCTSLSKGMKGKLNLIQCLMEDAEWYLLDEPASGLDNETLQELLVWLQRTSKHWIITTHSDVFDSLGAEVIVLDQHA